MNLSLLVICNPGNTERMTKEEAMEMAIQAADWSMTQFVDEIEYYDDAGVQDALITKSDEEVQACKVDDFWMFSRIDIPFMLSVDGKFFCSSDFQDEDWEKLVYSEIDKARDTDAWMAMFNAHTAPLNDNEEDDEQEYC